MVCDGGSSEVIENLWFVSHAVSGVVFSPSFALLSVIDMSPFAVTLHAWTISTSDLSSPMHISLLARTIST